MEIQASSRYSSGAIARRDLHCRPLTLFAQRADPEVLEQDGLASSVHHARGGPDLCIVMRVDVVHQEIDQPASRLQYCQKADNLSVCLI